MEYLYQINPILQNDVSVIIYGIGENQKNIFYSLLQQNIYVMAFCLKEGNECTMTRFFNKKIITHKELVDKYRDAYVVVSGKSAIEDGEKLRQSGVSNIVLENITLNQRGVLIIEE